MPVLVDTGVFLRAFVKADPHCGPIRTALLKLRRQDEELVVSFQNVAEFINVSTRPTSARGGYGLPVKIVQARVAFIERLCRRLVEDDEVYQYWKHLVFKYNVTGVAVHDARLVAIMLAYRMKQVLTVNDRDFRRYEPEGITAVTPQALIGNVT
ncbi:MAG: type II toxin-antitoxin system VapC family toxin [Pirellulales bacterium]